MRTKRQCVALNILTSSNWSLWHFDAQPRIILTLAGCYGFLHTHIAHVFTNADNFKARGHSVKLVKHCCFINRVINFFERRLLQFELPFNSVCISVYSLIIIIIGRRLMYAKDCINGRMTCSFRTFTTHRSTTATAVLRMRKATSVTCTAGDLVLLECVSYASRKVAKLHRV